MTNEPKARCDCGVPIDLPRSAHRGDCEVVVPGQPTLKERLRAAASADELGAALLEVRAAREAAERADRALQALLLRTSEAES